MSQSCGHNLPCNCRRDASEVIDKIKNQIQRCNQKKMSLEETMSYLQDTHQIDPYITKTIWEQLERENPVFLKAYHSRCEKRRQKKTCNSLLAEQVALMHDHLHLDLSNPPPEIVNILCQDPELRTRLLQNLANNTPSDRSEVSPQSLLLPDTNGQIVNQLQTYSDQQPQHHYQLSIPHEFANSQNPTVAWAATTAQDSRNPTFAQAATTAQDPRNPTVAQAATTAQDPQNPTVAQASTTAQDPSTSQVRDHIRENSLRELQTLQLGGRNNRIHFRELFNRLQNGESSNGVLNGGSNNGMQNEESGKGILNGGNNNGMQNGESSKRILNGGSNNRLQIGGSTNGLLNGERINGRQIGGRTNGLLDRGNICGIVTKLQNGQSISRIYYRRRINEQQDWENINQILNGGQINGLQGVIPQQNRHFQEQDIITVQDQGEPSYPTSDSEASNNSDSVTRD